MSVYNHTLSLGFHRAYHLDTMVLDDVPQKYHEPQKIYTQAEGSCTIMLCRRLCGCIETNTMSYTRLGRPVGHIRTFYCYGRVYSQFVACQESACIWHSHPNRIMI